jgi:hypothetical protein
MKTVWIIVIVVVGIAVVTASVIFIASKPSSHHPSGGCNPACVPGLQCIDGRCVNIPGYCKSTQDCKGHTVCYENKCINCRTAQDCQWSTNTVCKDPKTSKSVCVGCLTAGDCGSPAQNWECKDNTCHGACKPGLPPSGNYNLKFTDKMGQVWYISSKLDPNDSLQVTKDQSDAGVFTWKCDGPYADTGTIALGGKLINQDCINGWGDPIDTPVNHTYYVYAGKWKLTPGKDAGTFIIYNDDYCPGTGHKPPSAGNCWYSYCPGQEGTNPPCDGGGYVTVAGNNCWPCDADQPPCKHPDPDFYHYWEFVPLY